MITPDTTLGAELEFQKLGTDATNTLSNWLRFDLHNDGSVREHSYTVGSLSVIPQETAGGKVVMCLGMKKQAPYGLEIVTKPYTFKEFGPIAEKISYYFGHLPQNPRTAIHVHVDADGETWREVQSLLIWARALEAVIYRIACAGQLHRGCRSYMGDPNDHKFARPFSMPIGVEWSDGRTGPLILWDDIKNATSASELVAAWGRLDLYWGGGFEHYMPHRLHMINLASILRQGTIEWRVFDGLYNQFHHLVNFVYAVHRLAAAGDKPDFSFDLGTAPNIDADWVSKLLDFDVSPLWGENWQKGCVRKHPLSHYPNRPVLHTTEYRSVRPIMTLNRVDTRKDPDFPLFIR